MRALIVDDSRAMRTILQKLLEGMDFKVTAVEGAPEGLAELANNNLPDLMLVDWNMPEMNGCEFIRKVRANSKYDCIQIVMCTTETEFERVDEAIQAGANEYIMKPFTEDVIREKLKLVGMVRS